ncbi:hypothetical protein CY35_03G002300 [Sphagnum magellanicum]|nr:hypothetical protein CY35_03G002300 [Sphagnum magellanicum]KAH9566933.1 hypothetical protein CY35_03G002300 [Sphagnum magellanicum]
MGCRGAGAAATMALESQLVCAPSTSTDVGCCLPGCGMARGEKGRLIWGCNVPPPRPRPPYASFGKLRTKPKPGDCTRWKEGESGWSFLGVELHDDDEESMFASFSSCRLSRKPQVAAISTSEAFGQRGELGLRRRIGWQGRAKERDGRWGRTMAAGCWAGNRVCSEGLSCIFVGPIETAEKARLEALYEQARDSYYNGQPLIGDAMFDEVEARLRWHGSKLVLKYPRCSLKRFSAYADAEVDPSQMWALASVWSLLLTLGLGVAAGPPMCTISKVCQDVVQVQVHSHKAVLMSEAMTVANGLLGVGLGLIIGIPIAVAAGKQLQDLWRGDLIALKGCCPNCGEEVYAFVKADESVQLRHKTECHVCEHPLVFQANVERSPSPVGQLWAYGRVYLLTRSKDLAPNTKKS